MDFLVKMNYKSIESSSRTFAFLPVNGRGKQRTMEFPRKVRYPTINIVQSIKQIMFSHRFLDWTNSFFTERRDLYVAVINKDLLWLESFAVPLIE